MNDVVQNVEDLAELYGAPVARSLEKVVTRLTPQYRAWINRSRLVMLSTVGPEGTDCSPRGDVDPVVRIIDDTTLHLPDWQGNNRIDSLRNIVRDGRCSLTFLIPGVNNVVRLNGRAEVVIAPKILQSFDQRGNHPRSVVRFTVTEAYYQCAKSLMRSRTWTAEHDNDGVPTAGDFVKEVDEAFDGAAYDAGYADYAKDRMW